MHARVNIPPSAFHTYMYTRTHFSLACADYFPYFLPLSFPLSFLATFSPFCGVRVLVSSSPSLIHIYLLTRTYKRVYALSYIYRHAHMHTHGRGKRSMNFPSALYFFTFPACGLSILDGYDYWGRCVYTSTVTRTPTYKDDAIFFSLGSRAYSTCAWV